MKIKIIKYDGTEMIYDALTFEFRTNQVSNRIKIKRNDGATIFVNGVSIIKTIE